MSHIVLKKNHMEMTVDEIIKNILKLLPIL